MVSNICFAQANPSVVFVSRNLVHNGSLYYPQSGLLPGMGPFSRFTAVGGSLLTRDSSGTVHVLVDSTKIFSGITLIDIQQPCVFWDASKIVFAGIENRDSSWRIYEIHSDGTNFRKLTFTNRNINLSQFGNIANLFSKYDDIDPCYLPDGRICFASTHYPAFSEAGFRTTNLYVMNSDGTNIHRITTERNGAEKPTIDPISGRIVYSRWWLNIDLPSRLTPNGITRDTNLALTPDDADIWQAASIRPDGDGISLYAGHPETRIGLHSYKSSIMNNGAMLCDFIPYTPMTNTSGSPGIRWYSKGTNYPNYIAGVNANNMQIYIQNPPSLGTMIPPYATDAVQLPDGKILFSYATQVENQDYGLYTANLNGTGLTLFYDIPGKLELNAQVLLSKPVPPVVTDNVIDVTSELPPTIDPNTYFENGGFRFDCVNIFTNGDVDQAITDAPPITKNASIDFFLNFQRQDANGKDSAILLTRLPLDYAGGVHFDLAPGDVSMFEQVIDSSGKVVSGSKGQIAHVSGLNFGRPGTGTKCVGCHAGHTTLIVPATISEGQFTNVSTSANVTQSSFRYINDSLQYPGKRVVDRKAQNDSLTVNWIATGANNEFVDLHWDLPIDIR
ncbi:MAG: TolB family protein, partial [Ignavibacteria bacterium]